jgi:hypothetical protein
VYFRAFKSKVVAKKMNSKSLVLITSPSVSANTENAGPREFYHHYLSDRLLIQSILQELKVINQKYPFAHAKANYCFTKVKGQDQLELGESILSSSGIFTLLDEQLATYRPVQNNYLRWIADASGEFFSSEAI